jgi:hypothetical protein
MSVSSFEIRIKGKRVSVPACRIGDTLIVVKGRSLKIAEIFDEYWLEKRHLPDPIWLLDEIRKDPVRPDLFTFTQRVPAGDPQHDLPYEWENYAVIRVDTYDDWFRNCISSSARRNITASQKRGVIVRECSFDDDYVRGIMSIYNESPIRQGRKYWHYGKDFSRVNEENGTYPERSTYLGAFFEEEMIGYCKIVWDEETAAIMQVLSLMRHFDKRPNNALIAEAVKQCSARKIPYLLFENYVYGQNASSSLTEFKRNNGFVRMNVPRYYVPLTPKGSLSLRLGLHKKLKDRIPRRLRAFLIALRTKWYSTGLER